MTGHRPPDRRSAALDRLSGRLLRTTVADGLRLRVRRGVDLASFAGASTALLVQLVVLLSQGPMLRPLLAGAFMVALAACGLLGLLGRAPWTPAAYVCLCIVANAVYLVAFGPWLGLGAVYILGIALALLFGSARWARIVAAIFVATPLLIGIAFALGLGHAPSLALDDGPTWGRTTLAAVTALVGIALVSHHTVRQLVRERRTIEAALTRERAERAERDRVDAELARARRADGISQLAAEVGADIGAALDVILARARLLAADLRSPDATESLGDILEAAGNASSTMRQLTAFSPHTPTAAPAPRGNAAAALRALPKLVRRVLPPTIALELTCPDDAWVGIDTPDLTRLCANLVLNARDAIASRTPAELAADGPPTGHIAVALVRTATHAIITVRDDGSGMDASTLAHLFQPFFTTKPVGRGTGLGLATTKILVERAHGTITVESAVGVGTTFTLSLPLVA